MTQPVSQLDVTTYNDSRICGDLAMCVSPVPLRKFKNQNKLRIECKFRAEQYCTAFARGGKGSLARDVMGKDAKNAPQLERELCCNEHADLLQYLAGRR